MPVKDMKCDVLRVIMGKVERACKTRAEEAGETSTIGGSKYLSVLLGKGIIVGM